MCHNKISEQESLVGRKVKVEISENESGETQWYSGTIKKTAQKKYTITFDGFDNSHDIVVPVEEYKHCKFDRTILTTTILHGSVQPLFKGF